MKLKEFTFVHVLGTIFIVAFIIIGIAVYASAKKHEEIKKIIENTDLSQCDVVGNALDGTDHGVRILRNIYHCDDGSIYIR